MRCLSYVAAAGLSAVFVLASAGVHAQDDDATERARQLLAEAQAHYEGGRRALAAESYMQLYETLRGAGSERAPIALWNAGEALADVAGREQDAIATLRRFLDESTTLTEDPDVRDWRSEAVSLIDELEARVPHETQTADALGEPSEAAADERPQETPSEEDSTSISPIGPVVLGVGGALLVPGLIIAAVGLVENQGHIDDCPARVDCTPTMPSPADVAATRDLGLVGDVLWIAGAGVAIVGLVLTLTLKESAEDEEASAALEVRGAPGGGVAALQVRFR